MSVKKIFESLKRLNEADSKQYHYTGTIIYQGKEYPMNTVVNGKSNKDALKNVKVQFLKNHNIDFKYVGLVKLDPEVVEVIEELEEPDVDDNNSYMYMGYYIKETPYGYEVYNGDIKLQGELATDAEARAYIQSLTESKVNEGHLDDKELNSKVKDARELFGDTKVLDNLISYLSNDVLKEFLYSEYSDLFDNDEDDDYGIDPSREEKVY